MGVKGFTVMTMIWIVGAVLAIGLDLPMAAVLYGYLVGLVASMAWSIAEMVKC